MSRRDIRYTIRFSEYEWNQLTKDLKENSECKFRYSTKEGRLNISAYIRDKLFKKEKEEKNFYKEIKQLTYQIRKIGVNINQVTAKINSGYSNKDSVFYLSRLAVYCQITIIISFRLPSMNF